MPINTDHVRLLHDIASDGNPSAHHQLIKLVPALVDEIERLRADRDLVFRRLGKLGLSTPSRDEILKEDKRVRAPDTDAVCGMEREIRSIRE